jgi:hypothetical protein
MSLHRSSLMGAALALTTALTASAALAQTPVFPPAPRAETQTSQPDMAMVIEGQLQSVNAATKTIVVKTAAGKDETVRYDDATKVTGGQSGVAGLANSKGTDVTVKYSGHGEERVATEITIRQKKS